MLSGATCCYCGTPIIGRGVMVQGVLDNGEPGTLSFVYHNECALEMEFDVEESGCFSYGSPVDCA